MNSPNNNSNLVKRTNSNDRISNPIFNSRIKLIGGADIDFKKINNADS